MFIRNKYLKNIKQIKDDLIKENLLNIIKKNNQHYDVFNQNLELFILNNQYVFEKTRSFIIVNEQGLHSRLDGPAVVFLFAQFYWINDIQYNQLKFAEKTNHLVCKYCQDFCGQQCI